MHYDLNKAAYRQIKHKEAKENNTFVTTNPQIVPLNGQMTTTAHSLTLT